MTGGERELPKGWAWSTIGEISRVEYGKGLPQAARVQSGDVVIYGSAGPSGRHNEALVEDPVVVVGRKGNAGKVWLTYGPSWPIDTTYFVRPPHGVHPTYLAHQLTSLDLVEKDSSTTIPSLRRPDLEAARIALPPVAEQGRIVAAIEEHLSRLDAAEASLHATERRLGVMLRAILATASSGDWPKKPLAEITRSLRNGTFVSRPAAEPPGVPIYRISAVRPLNLRTDDVRYANPEPANAESYAVEAGDLLFTRYSGNPDYVGAAAVVPHAGAGVLHPDKLIRVVADRSMALPEWIAAYVTAGEGRREIERRLKTTAGQVGISGSQLKTVPIPVPPIDHQTAMVEWIATVRTAQERLAGEMHSATNHSAALRRSILAAAFSGRLVEQDPSDAPADALLARIVAERLPTKSGQKRVRA